MSFLKSKLKIGVFMGGRSIEHEVSFNSARTICDHIDSTIYEAIPIYQSRNGDLYILPWSFLHRGKTSDFAGRLESEAKKISWDDLKSLVDFIYLSVHGRYAEDGTLQGMLEVLQIPYLGSGLFTSSLTMDKEKQGKLLALHGIDVPREFSLKAQEIKELINLSEAEREKILLQKLSDSKINLPVVVKPVSEGSSLGVDVVFKKEQLWNAIINAAGCDASRIQTVLVEEKLEGMEFVCIHIEKYEEDSFALTKDFDVKDFHKKSNNKKSWMALPITEIVPQKDTHFFDYKQKYMPGVAIKVTPARCSAEDTKRIQDICLQASEISGFSTLSRIDGFLTKDGRVVLLDANTITGTGPATFLFDQAAEIGMSHTKLINHLIKVSLKEYGISQNLLLSNFGENKNMSENISKIKVAVLLGGNTNERETALESGRNVCYKLSPHKYEVIPVFVNDNMELFKLSQQLLVKNSTKIISELVTKDIQIKWADLPKIADFVFIGLHGGNGENGAVQGALEMLNLPYNGSGVFASSLCMDKFKTNNFLRESGFDVPESFLLHKSDWLALKSKNEKENLLKNKFQSKFDFPVILKPHDDGCSVYVQKLKNFEQLVESLDNYFESTEKNIAMIEQCVFATELTCGVIGNDEPMALVPSQPIVVGDILSMEEKFLPGAGENQTPANIPQVAIEKVREVMASAYKAIGCKGYARIDCFYQDAKQSKDGKDHVIILEINTLPATTPATCIFHQAAELGIKPMEFVDKIVQLGFENNKVEKLGVKTDSQIPFDKKPSDLRSN
ncbi:TPA: hypothetical protein DEO28_04565 [Candidatus Dependentiae bacterium]|nr:MAG: D-alanine-D-alanine ligase A [candidate division TM6 bacterium GW2011_GWE2_31_21]KKP53828.1 MAG: D-alanine-D-alanine ligase A [candidate division TM6 bacterium GW2011_GWF2_33_332]HBS47608.1 hypothetical protein [Candidatus Dependentiae bacterium]HBZ73757.1 hypothetical protein [Candidatus Dependentiae bacterium]